MDNQEFANLQPDQFFSEMKKRIQEQGAVKPGRELTDQEERKMQDGFALDEMTKTPGWKVLSEILGLMPMAHIDPRGMKEEEWKFAQLNAFWQGEVAKTLVDSIGLMIQEAHQLHGLKVGESNTNQRMRF